MKTARCFVLVAILSVCAACTAERTPYDIRKEFLMSVGLKKSRVGGIDDGLLETVHRGVPILFRVQASRVGDRFIAQAPRERTAALVAGTLNFLIDRKPHLQSQVTGSAYERLLTRALDEPMALVMVAKHPQGNSSRLDILSPYASIVPEDAEPVAFNLDGWAGTVRSRDIAFAERIGRNADLISHLEALSNQYIRVDQYAVTFVFTGTEPELDGLIRDHGSYEQLVTDIMDVVATIAQSV